MRLSNGLLLLLTFPLLLQAYEKGRVNNRTLNYFLNVTHLELPCYLPIQIKAAYNSYADGESFFGEKWTFNHNIRVVAAGLKFKILEGDGFENEYSREKNIEEANKAIVEQILVAKKKADSKAGGLKSASAYEDYKKQLLTDKQFRESEAQKNIVAPPPLGPGQYYSFARGASILEMKKDKSFLRTYQNGAYEEFDPLGRIIKSVDPDGNFIHYFYQGNQLIRMNDSCGRFVSFHYQKKQGQQNLIEKIKDVLGREMIYEFDNQHYLKTVTNADKLKTEYQYDKNGFMTTLTYTPSFPSAKSTPYNLKYNAKKEVEVFQESDKEETTYKRTFVGNNRYHSITEITQKKMGKTVSRLLKEYKVGEYERETQFDPQGNEMTKETRFSPKTSYPISVLDKKGQGSLLEYDAETGDLLKQHNIPSNVVTEFTYNKVCRQIETSKLIQPNTSPLLTRYHYNKKCHVSEAKQFFVKEEKDKKKEEKEDTPLVWITADYNNFGRPLFIKDRLNNIEIGFTYWEFGKPDSITLKNIGTLLVRYNKGGEIDKVDMFPHGEGKKKFEKMEKTVYQSIILSEVREALEKLLPYLKPGGLDIGL